MCVLAESDCGDAGVVCVSFLFAVFFFFVCNVLAVLDVFFCFLCISLGSLRFLGGLFMCNLMHLLVHISFSAAAASLCASQSNFIIFVSPIFS